MSDARTHKRTTEDRTRLPVRSSVVLFLLVVVGCAGPNAANIELRKRNQELGAEVDGLKQQLSAANAQIAGLRSQQAGGPPVISQDALGQIYSAHRIEIGRQTRGTDAGLRLYFTPRDQSGHGHKAVGRLLVEASELKPGGSGPTNKWELSPKDFADRWRSLGPLEAFVFELPWQQKPAGGAELELKVFFEDLLSRRQFSEVQKIRMEPAKVP